MSAEQQDARRQRRTRYRLRVATVAACLTLMCVLAGAVAARVYHGRLLVLLVAGAAVGAFAIGLALRNRPAFLAPGASAAGLAAYLLGAIALTSDGTEPLPVTVLDALANAVPRTLTALIPVEPAPDTVVVPVFLAWLAATLSCEFAIRYGRTLLGCLPATLLYAAGLYLVGPNADPGPLHGVAYCVLAAAALAVTAAPPERRPDRDATVDGPAPSKTPALMGAVLTTTVLLAAVALLGPVAARFVTSSPGDPREYVEPPRLTDIDLNPLVRIAEWAKYPEQELFKADTSADAWMRLAVLTEYDGTTWQATGDFRTAGTVVPGAGEPTYSADVEIIQLGGKLVPAAADPASVTDLPIAVNLHTKCLLTPDGLATGAKFHVDSALVTVDRAAAETARPDLSDATTVAVPPGTPEIMVTIADYIRAQYATPYERAQGLADFLSRHYAYDAEAPSGHDLPALGFFLGSAAEAGGQRGTSEQFAAAYAVIARLVGLPTRVVVGFDVPAGSSTVTAAQGLAWPEVAFDGPGWVRFDPMPAAGAVPTPPEDALEQMEEETPSPEEAEGGGDDAEDYNDDSLEQDGDFNEEAGQAESGLPVWVWYAAAALLLACVPLVFKARRALRRRRRLTRGTPAERVAGAWAEVLSEAARAGVKVPGHANAEEAAVRLAVLEADIGALPRLVNAAAFAPSALSEEDARTAVSIVAPFSRTIRHQVKWVRRFLT
ncbi:transglutaminase-like domain-containing protein [Glycomyces sp. TRM65418]|uniref:transglutaminase-like domain-containing protein n=1 Tax=Glycomyces sp. TRM65418 TaxID=2867006 RepID=UPI001CE64B28|nr:transglutaminase-like domain-containing protein [Glycomyces sp. TRM65418]MCC3762982.1 transglutaminase-like domain-containing protein [Glycomyces sp. TRM65418]QZD57000.1 transglutaminase-like domain-containing protein [Glycomyces sp. TRM65418]